MIELTNSDLENLLLYSFRYALGRSTYAANDVADLINDYSFILSEQTKSKMVEEIEDAVLNKSAGTYCDVECWEKLAEELK